MRKFLISFLYAVLVSLAVYCSIAIFYLFKNGVLEISFIQAHESVAGLAYGICLYLLGASTGALMNRLIPQKDKVLKRIICYSLFICLFSPLVIFCINFLISVIWLKHSFAHFIDNENWFSYIPLTVISVLIGLGFHGFYYYKYHKNKQIEQQKRIAGEATAQFETLKNQIDPHFLFNSLNVLIGLIEEDKQNAIAYTKSLSRIYRYILEHKDKDRVSIMQELEFARNYISLLQIRFEGAIQYDVKTEDFNEEMNTVPLALQLLLENCIQHNKASEEIPLQIRIYKQEANLLVENNLQPKMNKINSTKVGLKNINERYLLVSNKSLEIVKTSHSFTVKLPII